MASLETFLDAALEQAPVLVVTLGALLWIVRTFLAHIDHATDLRERLDESRLERLAHLGDECHAMQRECAEAISSIRVTLEANNRVIEENSAALRLNSETYKSLAATHEQMLERLRTLTPTCPIEGRPS
ncbi:MAG: hypothetical protein AAGJ46_07725 [Planctomycetota bacterium]